MPIHPLPQFEADLKLLEEDRKIYDALSVPKSLVVRFGFLKLVGEFPYDGTAKPGCGSKVVVRTHRGTEIGEMLTSTCPNSGCSKSVSRKDMLQYIENSGGRDYPFFTEGRVLRVVTPEDLDRQTQIEQSKHELKMSARRHAEALGLPVKMVDAEPLLGGERVLYYYNSEQRVDFRDLVPRLSRDCRTRVELRQIGARDEARLTADYEKCGQYCCCKNFLKVLKPISMKSAKVQKATLDPLKISGRCGRLMCCLRYEDETYEDLRKRLPRKKTRVGTPEGDGTVVDGQILTQLVLVELDEPDKDGQFKRIAVPVENLTPPASSVPPPRPAPPAPGDRAPLGPPGGRPAFPRQAPPSTSRPGGPPPPRPAQPPRAPQRPAKPPAPPADDDILDLDDIPGDELPGPHLSGPPGPQAGPGTSGTGGGGKRRRRRRRRGGPPGGSNPPQGPTP